MGSNKLLPSPIKLAEPLTKAPRSEHPSEPTEAFPPAAAQPSRGTATNRLGPNRVRKSFYLPTDIAEDLTETANRIHHLSNGRISKAEAAGTIIRTGLDNITLVYELLDVTPLP